MRAYHGIVTGETILGANIFRDVFAGIRDIVGGRSAAYEQSLAQARETAIGEMTARARDLGVDLAQVDDAIAFDLRRALHKSAREANPAWPAIPLASAVEQCAVERQPVGAFAPRSPAARAIAQLWTAIEKKLASK